MWGNYCCRHEWEGTTTEQIIGCDGNELSVNSTCCKDNEQIKCAPDDGYKNRRGNLISVGTEVDNFCLILLQMFSIYYSCIFRKDRAHDKCM